MDLRPGLLHRLGFEHHRSETEVFAVVLDHRLRPQLAADHQRLVDALAATLEIQLRGVPFLLQPARTDAEFQAPARQHVQGRDGARRDERVAQANVVHVGADADVRRARRNEAHVGEHVEHRHVGRHRRMVLAVIRAALAGHRKHQVLGQPHRLETQPVGLFADRHPQARIQPPHRQPDLHLAVLVRIRHRSFLSPSTKSVTRPAAAASPSCSRRRDETPPPVPRHRCAGPSFRNRSARRSPRRIPSAACARSE